MLGAVHKEVVDDHHEHVRVAVGQVLLALLDVVFFQGGAVVGCQVFLETELEKQNNTWSSLTSKSAAPALTMALSLCISVIHSLHRILRQETFTAAGIFVKL